MYYKKRREEKRERTRRQTRRRTCIKKHYRLKSRLYYEL